MTAKCTAQLLTDLGVTQSLGRPRISNDNPYSEAQFKTVKYHPGFPGRFGCIEEAKDFCRTFFQWYNTEHRHGGIGLLTPNRSTSAARRSDRAPPERPRRSLRRPPRPLRRRPAERPGNSRPRCGSTARSPSGKPVNRSPQTGERGLTKLKRHMSQIRWQVPPSKSDMNLARSSP